MTSMCSTYQIWHTDKHYCSGYINRKPIRCLEKLIYIRNSEMALNEKSRMPCTPHGLTCALSCADAMQIWPICDNSCSIWLTACWSKVMVTSFALMLDDDFMTHYDLYYKITHYAFTRQFDAAVSCLLLTERKKEKKKKNTLSWLPNH